MLIFHVTYLRQIFNFWKYFIFLGKLYQLAKLAEYKFIEHISILGYTLSTYLCKVG